MDGVTVPVMRYDTKCVHFPGTDRQQARKNQRRIADHGAVRTELPADVFTRRLSPNGMKPGRPQPGGPSDDPGPPDVASLVTPLENTTRGNEYPLESAR